jgi:glucosamine kinase
MRYFIGVDGGGSRTRAVVVNDMFQIVGQGDAEGSNHYVVGLETAAQNCSNAAEAAIADAARIETGLRRNQIAAWGLGLAGVRREGDAVMMRAYLAPLIGRVFILDHDAAAAQSGAFGGGPGIVLSGGTGAICFGIDAHGERFFADGWGALLGDEGSGYWMGQQALRAVCRAADGRGPRTHLTGPVLDQLEVRDCDALVQLVYSPTFTRDRVAKLAQIVFDSAAAGGQVAIKIREEAATHLGSAITAVTRAILARERERTEPNQPTPLEISITLRGGLFDDDYFRAAVGYIIGERLVELKRGYWPIASWRIIRPQYDAAVGAALFAQKHFGFGKTI